MDAEGCDDWEDICNGAIIELPDGSRWRRADFCDTYHDEAVREATFRRMNDGISSEEAENARLEACEKGLPEPYFKWRAEDFGYHDVFERIDGRSRYCLACGAAWE